MLTNLSNVVLQAARALIEKEHKVNAREEACVNATTATSIASNLPAGGGAHVGVSTTSAPAHSAPLSPQGIIDGHLVSKTKALQLSSGRAVHSGAVCFCVFTSISICPCSRSEDGSSGCVRLRLQAVPLDDNFDSGAETEVGSAVTVFSDAWSGGYDSG